MKDIQIHNHSIISHEIIYLSSTFCRMVLYEFEFIQDIYAESDTKILVDVQILFL